jgi:hypothetical protein
MPRDPITSPPKERTMKTRLNPIPLCCALLCSVPVAHADVDYVDIRHGGISLNAATVTVNPVNGRFAQIVNPETFYNLEMKAGCKGLNNHLKDTYVAFGNANANGKVVEADPNAITSLVLNRSVKSMDWVQAVLKVPTHKLGGALDPVAICNAWLDQRLAQGANLQQVLSKDHSVLKPVTVSAVASCGKSNSGPFQDEYRTKTMGHHLTVVCKAGNVGGSGGIQAQVPAPPPSPGALTKNLAVVSSDLKLLTPNLVGKCPAKVQFQADIQVDAAGELDYTVNFPHNANTPSQKRVGKLIFNGPGSQKTPIFEFTANTGYPVGVTTLVIEQPGKNKAHANFSVQCVQAPAGGSIQFNPAPGSNSPGGVLAPDAPKPPLTIQVTPVTPPPPPPTRISNPQ